MFLEAPDENEWARINLHQPLQGSILCNKNVLQFLLNVNFWTNEAVVAISLVRGRTRENHVSNQL